MVSDSGEGAQKCGQGFGAVSAKMGNGVWTVEIIPAEIQPPPRSPGSASGVRIRIGTEPVTNWGDDAKLVVAFNEQVLLARHRLGALADDAIILIEDMWATHADEGIVAAWKAAMEEMAGCSYRFIGVPMEMETLEVVDNPRRGKNMFALGLLAWIYDRVVGKVKEQIAHAFRKKPKEVYEKNAALLDRGVRWAEENLDFRIDVPTHPSTHDMVVMNGNTAIGMGAMRVISPNAAANISLVDQCGPLYNAPFDIGAGEISTYDNGTGIRIEVLSVGTSSAEIRVTRS